MSTVWHYLNRYRGRFAVGVLLLLVTNGLSLTIPRLLKGAIDGMENRVDLAAIGRFAAAILVVATAQGVVRTLSRLQLLGLSRRAACDLRDRLFDHLLHMPAEWFDRHRTGDLMSRAVNDMRSVRSLFGPGVLNLANTAIVYVAGLYLMARIDWRMTLLALAPYPFFLFSIQRIGRLVHRRTNETQVQLASISNRVQENLSGVHLVRTFAQEDNEIAAFENLNREYLRANLRLARARGGIMTLMGAVGGLGTAVVLWIGGLAVLDGRIGLGDFVAFNGYLALLAWPTVAMGWVINVFQRGFAALARIHQVLDAPVETEPDETGDRSGGGGQDDTAAPAAGDITVRNLTFRYSGAPRPALEGVNLNIPAGAFVGVVGGVGAGKSTLAHLLVRLYRPDHGEIRIGDRRLESIPTTALRRGIALAPQEPFLFSRSLEENVGLGLDRPDPGRVREAGRIARLDSDIADMPDGWSTRVGERGFTLSGGQRQRAALARTVAIAPSILILDDSLSSLDAETERDVLREVREETAGRTLVLISHRLAGLLGADRIFVLDRGRLVEEGAPNDLLARGGRFAELFRHQQLGGEAGP